MSTTVLAQTAEKKTANELLLTTKICDVCGQAVRVGTIEEMGYILRLEHEENGSHMRIIWNPRQNIYGVRG